MFSFSNLKSFRFIKNLQKLFIYSLSARLKSVRVLEENTKLSLFLSETLSVNSNLKFHIVLNLRRNIVPRFSKKVFISKKVGLSLFFRFPNFFYRAFQVLWHMAVIPYLEVFYDSNSFGFKPYRDCSDIFFKLKTFISLKNKFFYVLNSNFDFFFTLDNAWLLKNFLVPKQILLSWILPGFSNARLLQYDQFDISKIYPTIFNFILNGLLRILVDTDV